MLPKQIFSLWAFLLPLFIFAQPCSTPIYYQENDPCFLELAKNKQNFLYSKKSKFLAAFNTNAPEQNCKNALPVCRATYVQTTPYLGSGTIEDIFPDSTCLKQGERNSVWYIFSVQNGGTLGFEIVVDQDYDFALYDITTSSCEKIPFSKPIRCNYSSAQGPRTGLDPSRTFAGPISVDHNGNPMMPGLNVQAGQTYALVVSKFTNQEVGYTLNFTGTASIIDNEPPRIVATPAPEISLNCERTLFRVKLRFSEPIACSSVAPEDFQLQRPGPIGQPLRVSNIICGPDAYSTEITLEIPVTPPYVGNYLLRLIGSIEDKCGNELRAPNLSLPLPLSPPLRMVINTNFALCNGGTTRNISITPVGGISPYTYQLDQGSFTSTPFFTNLQPGLRKLTIRDGQGCFYDTTIYVPPVRPNVAIREISKQNPNCQESNSGSIEVEILPGFAPYKLLWNTGATTPSIHSLAAGEYSLTVTDSAGCTASYRTVLSSPSAPRIAITEIESIRCFGGATGALRAEVQGGVPPYSYLWSNGTTGPEVRGLRAGSYSIELTDAAKCMVKTTYELRQPQKLEVELISLSHESCRNAKDGEIQLSITGGTFPYLIRWDPNLPPRPIQRNLSPGSYSAQIIDANQCATQVGPFLIEAGIDSCVSGIINRYYKVIGFDKCENAVTIGNTTGLTVGQEVLLIQMQGAVVDSTESEASGSIINLGTAGNYERATIASINGRALQFKEKLLNTYEPNFQAQLVTIPKYTNIVINDTLTAQAWNGNTGGILIFDAQKVELRSAISVAGKGFRGGRAALNRLQNNNCNQANFHYEYSSGKGGEKGEGIALAHPRKFAGKGAWANGGGGGNEHNAGGGGGGNAGNGGNGGVETASCPQNPNFGRGGRSINLPASRITMGGGGGGGHQNDNAGTPGANGGGIIFIRANQIKGNSQTIDASGANVTQTGGRDGAGGGGAGGSIILEIENFEGNVIAKAAGGKGGDIRATECHGAGGGGSGGVIRLKNSSLPPQLPIQLNGGAAGSNLLVCNNPVYNGKSGEVGELYFNYTFPKSTVDFIPKKVTITAEGPTTFCQGNTVTLRASGEYQQYEWIRNGSELSGTTASIQVSLPGAYRLKVIDDDGCELISNEITIELLESPQLRGRITEPRCAGQFTGRIEVDIIGGLPPYTYRWSNNTTFSFLNNVPAGIYSVVVTDARGCATTQSFTISEPSQLIIQDISVTHPSNSFASDGAIVIVAQGGNPPYNYALNNNPFQGQNEFGGLREGRYTVTISDVNGCTTLREVILSAPCLAPTQLQVSLVTAQSALLRWRPYSNIQFYEVSFRPKGTTGGNVLFIDAPIDSLLLSNLLPETEYEVEIKAACVNGTSQDFAQVQFITLPICLSPIVGRQQVCRNTTLSIRASYIQQDAQLHWYSESGTLLFIGNPFVTTPLIQDTVFKVTTVRRGCESEPVLVPVAVLPLPEVRVVIKNITCASAKNGSITTTIRSGTPPYTYLWNNGATSSSIINLAPGNYFLRVTDANNCSVEVGPLRVDSTDIYYTAGDYTVGANVLRTATHCFTFNRPAPTTSNAAMYNLPLALNQPFWIELSLEVEKGNSIQPQYLDWELRAEASFISPAFKLRLQTHPLQCDSLVLEWNGGRLQVAPLLSCEARSRTLQIQWDPVARLFQVFQGSTLLLARNISLSNLLGTNQAYWFLGALQRMGGGEQNICVNNIHLPCPCSNPLPSIRIRAEGNLALCQGDSLRLSVLPGFSNYWWSNYANTSSIWVSQPGRYAVIVENELGCRSASDTLTIFRAPTPTVRLVTTHPSCSGFRDGRIRAEVQGGTAPYQYRWSNGATSQEIINLSEGSYSVNVIDVLGCKAQAQETLIPPISLNLSFIASSPSSPFLNDGSVLAQISGGTPPYTYRLGNISQSIPLFTNLAAGEYVLLVRDSKGCEVSTVVTLVAPCIPPILTVSEISTTSCRLSWNSIPNATGYILRYRVQGTTNFEQLRLPSITRTVVLSSLQPGTFYEVQILTLCQGLQSSESSITFSTPRQCLPPTNLQVENIGLTFAQITWQQFSEAVRCFFSYRTKGSGNWQTQVVTNPPLRLENLLPNTVYEFTLQSDCGGELFSVKTSISEFRTLRPCPSPSSFGVRVQESAFVLSWELLPEAIEYLLRYKQEQATEWQSINLTRPPYMLNGEVGKRYLFELQAICPQGVSTAVVQTAIIPKTCPSPQNLRAEQITSTSALILWSPSPNVEAYELAYRKVNTPDWQIVATSTEQVFVTNLIPGITYEMVLRARCDVNTYSSYHPVRQFITPWECVAPLVINVQKDSTSAVLSWEGAAVGVTAYQVVIREWSSEQERRLIFSNAPARIEGLKPQTRYQFE
ncbi:MAG: fibronectin type III domain-containing protein, partial [Bacteroidia bacterium]|nr:fibronectin type III domain-containing protein [Bacteroidia bacterium]